MSYGLSFSKEFYSTYGDANGVPEVNSKGQPCSLHSAIVALLATPSRDRARLCASMRRTVAYLQEHVGEVIDAAREIDTCDSIGRNGVPVYLTPFDSGWGLTVTVYEADPEPRQFIRDHFAFVTVG